MVGGRQHVPLKVVELFAGVGGFRIGFEGPPGVLPNGPKVIWANQWEPSTRKQHAAEVYAARWGLEPQEDRPTRFVHPENNADVLVNEDIATIDVLEIPEHDILCGGFPCQDYSVAKTLDKATGLGGKKGVLWWEIHRIASHHKPRFLLLENVDRLLKSPRGQRGRDFAVMLASLDELGYMVEWRVIDASSYGFPQRRKRVFILAHHQGTHGHEALASGLPAHEWLEREGPMAKALPIHEFGVLDGLPSFNLRRNSSDDLADVTDRFNAGAKDTASPFQSCGVMFGGAVWTAEASPKFDGHRMTLGDILVAPSKVDDEFILPPESLLREKGWIYLKGGKKEERNGRDGFTYRYSEGPITFPDVLDRPSRTIITGEGGSGPSRFKHVVTFHPSKAQRVRLRLDSEEANEARKRLELPKSKWVRRLVPEELEQLNGFPAGHTEGPTDGRRAFFMGNALVCGVVQRIGAEIENLSGQFDGS